MKKIVSMLVLFIFLFCAISAMAEEKKVASIPETISLHDRTNLKSWGFFYAGGAYEESSSNKGSIMRGQMYVEVFEPFEVTKQYPLVFLHGNYQTGLNWMGTADGQDGWVDYFLGQGYILYVVDCPTRGRASYPLEPETTYRNVTAERALSSFAGLGNDTHTQWPGEPELEDKVFMNFYATQNVSISSDAEMQQLVKDASTALLDMIGEAIIITHSQSGPYGWLLADSRPELVKGVVALEPSSPTFRKGTTDFGVAGIPLTFEPAITSADDLETEKFTPDDPNLNAGLIQKEPARQLVNMKGIPTVILTSEASYHNSSDYLISMFLKQAGVQNEHIYLKDVGIYGNNHMMMLEKNSLEIASFVNEWIINNILNP